MPRSLHSQRGVALVELALVLPLLLAVCFAITEFGRAIYTYDTLAKSARDAARYLTTQTPGSSSAWAIARNLVAYGNPIAQFAQRLLQIITGSGERAARLVALTASTVRGVLIGVVGVAAIQSVLLGIGFFAIGLPAAGLLTLVTLLLGIVQVPATLVTLPIIAYVLATEPTGPAIIFSIWTFVAGLSDNVLKPLMLGRGLEVPMPIILIGVIGGMVADGLLGLFVGPVLLAVAYVLFVEWLKQHSVEGGQQVAGPTP